MVKYLVNLYNKSILCRSSRDIILSAINNSYYYNQYQILKIFQSIHTSSAIVAAANDHIKKNMILIDKCTIAFEKSCFSRWYFSNNSRMLADN